MFVSTFHSVRLTSGATWTFPSLDDFIDSLTQGQNKLINKGKIKVQKVHALTMQDGSSHKYQKYNDKYKSKAHANPKKEGYSKPFNEAFRYKGGKD